ncbi:MAG: hypothetical protein ACP5NS_05055 [Candidatus Pacearchaeota archaeon]
MNPEDVKAEMMRKGAPAMKKPAPKAPPKLMKKESPADAPRVSGGNPFEGAREEMMEQMGGEMNQGPEITINGEPVSDPMQIAEFVSQNPEIMAALAQIAGEGVPQAPQAGGLEEDME